MTHSDISIRDRACYLGEVLALLSVLNEQGCATHDALTGTDIEHRALLDWRTKISLCQQLQLHRNGVRMMSATSLALAAGRRLRLSSFGFAGGAFASADSLATAIEMTNRFAPLMGAKFHLKLRKEGSEAVLGFEFLHSFDIQEQRFCIELEMSKMLTLLREAISPDFRLTSVALNTSAELGGTNNREYAITFGTYPSFNAPNCEMRFDSRWLRANPVARCNLMYESCVASCERIMSKVERCDDVCMRVKNRLLSYTDTLPTLTELAQWMNVSPRTLRRKLADQGMSYNQLVDEVRKQLAINFLSTSRMSAEEISGRVGYSDASNFRHAFRRWTGLSPSDFRESMLHGMSVA
ncbi:AraC-like DNA-binding protein [Paraburkholderia sp. BL27I4N3]|uniref:AraC family transcriptional regulator n=1 Tax=Paraburkholderia sp. BL27I4N3 TaxID=1938805 RepID=UPI000E274A35|nr:AraC family transcriptional regulator [Paraburkholderia sp. BL27I4N3]REE07534.1 AraC-like DNA-binding protein [Paraburkholderia sp. BL27I4N3]